MPFYDYFCEANGKTVEVFHPMAVKLKTWGEICQYAHINLGKAPRTAPVKRVISNVTPKIFKLKGLDKDQPAGKKLLV